MSRAGCLNRLARHDVNGSEATRIAPRKSPNIKLICNAVRQRRPGHTADYAQTLKNRMRAGDRASDVLIARRQLDKRKLDLCGFERAAQQEHKWSWS